VRALFVKLGAIGDIVHALPALAAAKREFPEMEITWVAERRSAEILRGNPLIDELVEVDTRAMREGSVIDEMIPEIRRQLGPLRRMDVDVAIDLQGLLKSAVIAKLSGAPKRWGFAKKDLREPASRFFLTDTVAIPPRTHIIRKNLSLVSAALGLADTSEINFPIFTEPEHRVEANEVIGNAGGRYALLNPAGGWVTKLWQAEKFGKLADRIWSDFGLIPVIVTGPKEKEIAMTALSASTSGKTMSAEPSLKGFYELAKRAAVYVGGDTGPTHLAMAAGTPIVGIFGPTEWWRNGSISASDICVERMDIGCRVDCHRRTCSNWICMDIDVDRVGEAVGERLHIAAQRPALSPAL
jgi:heptosyltransferase-1